MIASDESGKIQTQPQGSGWFIAAPSPGSGHTVEVNGVNLEVGPDSVSNKIVNMLRRWMYREYEVGISPADLARKVALAHGGMLCKAPRLTLNLRDNAQFPALGSHSSEPTGREKNPRVQLDRYWFSNDRKRRASERRNPDGQRGLPSSYVQAFSDTSRGESNNLNPKYLSDYTALELGIPSQDLADFMSSGLGPKEYCACSRILKHLKARINMARDKLTGDDFARETRDVALDAALITMFSRQVGLPVGFGDRLWRHFAEYLWRKVDCFPEDVISDCIHKGALGDNVGAAAVTLLRRVNPSLVWNYSGKTTPLKAERRAENAVIEYAQELLAKFQQQPVEGDLENFSRLKYPDSETSSSELSDVETRREKEEDTDSVAPEADSEKYDVNPGAAKDECVEAGLHDEKDDPFMSMTENNDPEAEVSSMSSTESETEGFMFSPSSRSLAEVSASPKIQAGTNKNHQHGKEKKQDDKERIRSKRRRGDVKVSRHGGDVTAAISRETQQHLGEKDGVIEYLREQLEEVRAAEEDEDKFCGFDPEQVITFKNHHGMVVMRPTRDGISVSKAYRKGAHLFGWISEVTSGDIEGTCFIPVDKLMYMKNRYWSRATEVCKTSLLTSLVGEKWPYMSDYYLRPVDLERKAYDIIFDSSPDPDYRLTPNIRRSAFPKTESEILKRLRVSDPNYIKENRAYQLLPLDDTYMAYHFPICVDELEKMMCKRLTSKFSHENWKIPEANSPWFKLYGDRTWDIEFDPQSNFGFFREYAEKIIAVKSTLSRAEKKQWRDMADRIDLMSPNEIKTKLRMSLRAETNCFIKNELYAKDSTTLRLIISPSLFVKIVFGAIIKRIEERLYSGDADIPITGHHIKHVPLSHAETLFSSWQSKGDGQFYETDYSAYESSQNEVSLRTEFDLYKSYFRPNSLADEILDTVLEQMLSGTVVVRNKYFSIRMPVMRWSGMPNTACGNLLMNYYNLIVNCGLNPESDFLLEGDDGLIWGNEALGKELETHSAFPLTMQTDYDYTRLSFCGLHYEGDAHIPADENLAIAKLLTYFDSQELSVQKRYELLYLRLISYQLLYPKWPALNSIIQQAERFYHNSACKRISEATVRRWFNEQGWWMNQMLGDFDISDMILPGGSYAFVHLCYENIDSVKNRARPTLMARSEREMDRLLPDYRKDTSVKWLRRISNVISVAGPAIGVALALSGHRKHATATVVASAAATTIINEFVPPESSEESSGSKSSFGFLDKIWSAAGQVLPALFSFKSSDLSLDRSKISKPQASVIACKNGPASPLH